MKVCKQNQAHSYRVNGNSYSFITFFLWLHFNFYWNSACAIKDSAFSIKIHNIVCNVLAVLLLAQSSGFMKMGTFGIFIIIIACSQGKQGHSRHYIIVIIIMKSTQGDDCRELVTCMLWFSYNSAFSAIKLTSSLGGYKSRNAFFFV